MLKRLIIALFGISLVLAFGSTVLAGQDNPPLYELEDPSPSLNPNHPKLVDGVEDIRPVQPLFKKPSSALRALPSGTNIPAPPSSIYFCDLQSYAGALTWVFTIPDFYGDDLFNTRFTVEAGFECTLKTVYLAFYGDPSWGTPDARVYLWADDGFGFPGALLDSVDIPNASLPASGGAYVNADFSAAGWVFSDGDEYHYGYTTLGGAGDTLGIISDDAAGPYSGEERSSEYWSGAWGSMLNDWGADYVFEIVSERCCNEIPFTDCYSQQYDGGPAFVWLFPDPNPAFADSAYAMRFDVGGPETLVSVELALYGGFGALGDEDVYVTIYDDDGSGLPGTPLALATLTGGTYALYPAYASASFSPLVLTNTFHVAVSSAGVPGASYEAIVSDDGSFGVGRSSGAGDVPEPGCTSPWYTSLCQYAGDYNWLIRANLCRDEFSDCQVQDYYGAGDPPGSPGLAVPNASIAAGIAKWAQRFSNAPSGSECELQQLFFEFRRLSSEVATRPLMYTHNTLVHVVPDAGGVPSGGPSLYTATLTPADYAAAGYTGAGFFGEMYFTLNPNVVIPANFWVVFEPLAPIRAEGIRVGGRITTFDPAGVVEWLLGYFTPDAAWYPIDSFFGGVTTSAAAHVEASICCVPFSGRVCAPPDDWSVRSHDLARSGASQLAVGDAWCDLNLNWSSDELTAANALLQTPIIYNNRVYQIVTSTAVASFIRVFNLVTGVLEQTITLPGPGTDAFAENDPLIVNDKLYIAGGNSRNVYRYDISVPGAAVLDWTRTLAVAGGPVRRANLLLVNVAGTDVLFGGTNLGRAFAINESDGANYPGWAVNPITLDANVLVNGSATDGSQLYFGTGDFLVPGDVWVIDPATGGVNWKLSTAGGFQGGVIFPPPAPTYEAFPQLSVEAGVVYAGCICADVFPHDGIFYRLDAATGAVLSAVACSSPAFANPIIDINLVYMPTRALFSPAVISSMQGNIFAFNKLTGAIAWNSEMFYESNLSDRSRNNASLSCEPEPDADIIIASTEGGFVKFVNSLDGTDIFNRRIDFGPGAASRPGGTAIGIDSLGEVHVLVGSNRGGLYDLTKGVDRPRLEIQDYSPTLAAEFSVSTSVIYTVPDIITNTGCADLTFNAVNVDDVSFGSTDPGVTPFTPVRPELLTAAAMLSEQMAVNAKKFMMVSIVDEPSINDEFQTTSEESLRSERGYRAALAFPAYLNSVDEPYAGQVVAAGDSIPLVLDVNASLITRGPQTFYIELDTDDPDFFLNETSVALPNAFPQLVVTLVGGCLTDTTFLIFGVGSTDFQIVSNTTRLADSDWPETGWQYNGSPFNNTPIFQATYVFGVSTERIAMNVKNWFGQPEANSWFSVQADPNYCDNDCKPSLTTGVSLGAIWNGASYTPIVGNMICKSWIDSVQDYGLGDIADWDWRNYGAPFDDSLTMGVIANTRTMGVEDMPEFDNLTVEIFEVTNRSASDGIPDWKFGANMDYDASRFYHGAGHDTLIFDQSISASWTTSQSPTAHFAYGIVKLPFGCGYEPMVSTMGLDADQGHFEATAGRGDPYWDSCYFYLSLAPGTERSHPVSGAAQDEQSHSTLVWNDFAPSETITFASVNFGLDAGVSAPLADGGGGEIADLAHLTNKWVGFGRGDVNDDNAVNLADIMTLADIVGGSVPGAIPFEHLADVDIDNDVDLDDLNYLINYYFYCGACPQGDWEF